LLLRVSPRMMALAAPRGQCPRLRRAVRIDEDAATEPFKPRAQRTRVDSHTMDVTQHSEPTIAVFVDFENLALGAEQSNKGRFQMDPVMKRLLERGRIVFKRAYCDWNRFQKFMREFHML